MYQRTNKTQVKIKRTHLKLIGLLKSTN